MRTVQPAPESYSYKVDGFTQGNLHGLPDTKSWQPIEIFPAVYVQPMADLNAIRSCAEDLCALAEYDGPLQIEELTGVKGHFVYGAPSITFHKASYPKDRYKVDLTGRGIQSPEYATDEQAAREAHDKDKANGPAGLTIDLDYICNGVSGYAATNPNIGVQERIKLSEWEMTLTALEGLSYHVAEEKAKRAEKQKHRTAKVVHGVTFAAAIDVALALTNGVAYQNENKPFIKGFNLWYELPVDLIEHPVKLLAVAAGVGFFLVAEKAKIIKYVPVLNKVSRARNIVHKQTTSMIAGKAVEHRKSGRHIEGRELFEDYLDYLLPNDDPSTNDNAESLPRLFNLEQLTEGTYQRRLAEYKLPDINKIRRRNFHVKMEHVPLLTRLRRSLRR